MFFQTIKTLSNFKISKLMNSNFSFINKYLITKIEILNFKYY